ncbi:MAG: hypothetical protein ISS69_00285 [Phycisphaerae bacterium]|nr:hypothetical protein [Phycisphaerae bacterium]
MKTSNNLTLALVCLIALVLAGTTPPAMAALWTIEQITDNEVNDRYPQPSGSDIVWQRHDGADWEIILYHSGAELPPLTNNATSDEYPTISGDNVFWQQWDGNDNELFHYKISTTVIQPWTNNSRHDQYPHVSGDTLVWEGLDGQLDGNDWEIFSDDIANGPGETRVTNNSVLDSDARVSGDRIVWEGWDGGDLDIFLSDGGVISQLTTNSVNDSNPDVSSGAVVWQRSDGDAEIMLYDGILTSPITGDDRFDVNAVVSDTLLVWRHQDATTAADYEIMMLAVGNVYQLTDNDFPDGQADIDGDTIVWEGWDGHDWEIFTTTIPTAILPEPCTITLLALGSLAVLKRRPT